MSSAFMLSQFVGSGVSILMHITDPDLSISGTRDYVLVVNAEAALKHIR